MKKYILIAIALGAVFTFSCKEEIKTKASTETSQMKEVMAIHDEVMPKMSKIGRLVAALRKKIDADQGTAIDKKVMEDLQDANKSMMDWMQSFGKRFDYEETSNGKALTDEKKQWLNEEEEKVKIVKEKINTSIAKAEALLAE